MQLSERGSLYLRAGRRRFFHAARVPIPFNETHLSEMHLGEACYGMIGDSPAIRAVCGFIDKLGPCSLPILILGETGTGKELCARGLHDTGSGARPFVAVNCANLQDNLAESQLFGHEAGAFTDARKSHRGFLAQANGGTLFLDEVAELTPGLQGKLLRALEQGEYRPLGSERTRRSSFRLIAATSTDVHALMAAGRFRTDLYFRLTASSIQLPPLRDRGNDIHLIAEHFLERFSRRARDPKPELTPEAKFLLSRERWPGNVRQLRAVVEVAAVFRGGPVIDAAAVDMALERLRTPSSEPGTASSGSLREAVHEAEVRAIETALVAAGGQRTTAARLLRISPATLYRRLRGLDID